MMTLCAFPGDTLNENLLEQFLWGLKNENIESKLITQVDDLNFEKVVEKATAWSNAKIDILELKKVWKTTNSKLFSKIEY